MDKISLIKQTELFVLDMDGTYYLGDRILPGARAFLDAVTDSGRDYLFFTNNSSKSPRDYIDKLARMDTPITKERIMTSGDVMLEYLQAHHPGESIYLLGTPPLFESFEEAGIRPVNRDGDPGERPDLVVLGFDQTLTYARLTAACTYIREGAGFLATHPDINCPVDGGFIPDCGAMIAAMALSTGVQPKITGKPYSETLEAVIRHVNRVREKDGRQPVKREGVTFVGDRLYTDVATGVNNGAHGALVLSGETTAYPPPAGEVPAASGFLPESAVSAEPDAVYASLGEMGEILRNSSINC
ncbi:MAG: HAD-IIA family hydrolase [Lachnospiraceae bacterium]|nr:HAD-IIA family hydrolase [Lachnospiraceae bacterium]